MTDVRASDAGLYIWTVSYLISDACEYNYATGHQIMQGQSGVSVWLELGVLIRFLIITSTEITKF